MALRKTIKAQLMIGKDRLKEHHQFHWQLCKFISISAAPIGVLVPLGTAELMLVAIQEARANCDEPFALYHSAVTLYIGCSRSYPMPSAHMCTLRTHNRPLSMARRDSQQTQSEFQAVAFFVYSVK
ncbi:hypothetical protein NLX74_14015 [Paenibacillus sp. MZ03-122A]|nr:hypothetical protein [Paenibacillus sp. MZ03-122A]